MKLSLRVRVLLLLVAINAAVAGVLFAIAARELGLKYQEGALAVAEELVYTVSNMIRPEGRLNAASILQWPNWSQYADAMLVDQNLERGVDGRLEASGVVLNPVGSSDRGADFDVQAVLTAVEAAIAFERRVDDVAGGRVVPIRAAGRVWGACWYRIVNRAELGRLLLRYVLPAFLLSTLLLSVGTFYALRRFVLVPVEELAAAASKLARHEFPVRIPETGAQDELAELVRGFNGMAREVEGFQGRLADEIARAKEGARRAEAAAMTQRRLAAMGELAAGIAHEINNPLGGLQNAVEALRAGRLTPDKQRQYHDLLISGLARIQKTVGRLLHFTPRQSPRGPVSLGEVVAESIQLVQHRAQRGGVALHVHVQGLEPAADELAERLQALPQVEGEFHELGQALLNLLVNALDALEAAPRSGARIDVSIAARGGELELAVQDNGPGVAEADLPRLVDLFYTTKAPGKGTGLGLSIVHGIVTSHGGTLELDSAPGRGLCARVRLPVRSGT